MQGNTFEQNIKARSIVIVLRFLHNRIMGLLGNGSQRLRDLVLAGQYEQGLDCYNGLSDPSPEDDRMAGASLSNLQRLHQAKELLHHAQARGCESAAIELATVYRYLGQPKLATKVLGEIKLSKLNDFDLALCLREWGAIHFANGNLNRAIDVLERAWGVAYRSKETKVLLASIGHLLGLVCGASGMDLKATHYLQLALQNAKGSRASYIRLTRALNLSYLGQFEQASEELRSAQLELNTIPLAAPVYQYVCGVYHRAQGNWHEAWCSFGDSAKLAHQAQEAETGFYALLGLCVVQTTLGDYTNAQANASRAFPLIVNKKMEAFYLLRQGALRVRMASGDGISDIAHALNIFSQMGLRREMGWAWLHLAEGYLYLERQSEAYDAVTQATNIRYALGSGYPILIELRVLPKVMTLLAGLSADDYGAALLQDLTIAQVKRPVRVELLTLGRSEILVNGTPVKLRYRHSVEILTYLLEHPNCSLRNILLALFPDISHSRSRNYFHQVRYELKKRVCGLRIPYNSKLRSYKVEWSNVLFTWDLEEIKRAIEKQDVKCFINTLKRYHGSFLLEAEADWAQALRINSDLLILTVGRQIIKELFKNRDFQNCFELANLLTKLDSYDDLINELLIRASHVLSGRSSAVKLLKGISRLYERDFGELPSTFWQLKREFQV